MVNQWNSESSCKRSSPAFCTARSTVQFDGHRQSRFCVKCFSQPLRVGFILFWFYHSIIFHHVLSSCVHIRSSNLHIGKMTRRCPMKPIPWPGIGAWASQRRPLHSRIFENASTPLHFVFWPRKSFFHKRFFLAERNCCDSLVCTRVPCGTLFVVSASFVKQRTKHGAFDQQRQE